MKIRNDFVTNSSSSSFLVGFKDEESIEKELRNETRLGTKFDKVLKDIKKKRISKAEALHDFREEVYWDVVVALRLKNEREVIKNHDFYEWEKDFKNREKFYQEVNDIIDTLYEEFKQKLEDYGYIALVSYDDHSNPDLEYEIMPNLNCTIKHYSHH